MPAFRNIDCEMQDGVLVVRVLFRELSDEVHVYELERDVHEAASVHGASNIVLDMSDVRLLTSVAMMPIVGLKSLASARGGVLILCNLADAAAQALTITQLIIESRPHAHPLRLATDVPAALHSLQTSEFDEPCSVAS